MMSCDITPLSIVYSLKSIIIIFINVEYLMLIFSPY
ncbi:hypothetical protein KSS87_008435 [Heliosperma pusillum]|nr:hypothetical protein KSS87_008435 [Heliosperma pusillum]